MFYDSNTLQSPQQDQDSPFYEQKGEQVDVLWATQHWSHIESQWRYQRFDKCQCYILITAQICVFQLWVGSTPPRIRCHRTPTRMSFFRRIDLFATGYPGVGRSNLNCFACFLCGSKKIIHLEPNVSSILGVSTLQKETGLYNFYSKLGSFWDILRNPGVYIICFFHAVCPWHMHNNYMGILRHKDCFQLGFFPLKRNFEMTDLYPIGSIGRLYIFTYTWLVDFFFW